jgi:aminomethyltransferase
LTAAIPSPYIGGMATLRRTPLYPAHVRAGAKLTEFAGFEMPLQYSGLLEEHTAVRERAGLFDVSHMGEVVLRGPKAMSALQRLVTNDVAAAADGQAVYAAICNERGGIVDDVVVYRRQADDLLVCVNASNRDKDFAWIKERGSGPGVDIIDQGDDYAQLALQGPKAEEILSRLTKTDLRGIATYHHRQGEVAGKSCLIARTGYTGEDGFELFCSPTDAVHVWDELLAAGGGDGLIPCGLGARDSLRLEMKYCLYGNDIDDGTSPLEAGIGFAVKLQKPGGFIGAEVLQRQKAEGLSRKLIGFKLIERGIPRHGYSVSVDGKVQGTVTSGTMSPTLKIPIGMAYVPASHAGVGSRLAVDIRGRPAAAEVCPTPFYKRRRDKV